MSEVEGIRGTKVLTTDPLFFLHKSFKEDVAVMDEAEEVSGGGSLDSEMR
jgi:hypothetical protein